jgi:hypothetical protein
VVGKEIENQPQAPRFEPLAEPLETGLAPELGIERAVDEDVVTVRASRARLENRRGVAVAHAQPFQVVDDRRRLL